MFTFFNSIQPVLWRCEQPQQLAAVVTLVTPGEAALFTSEMLLSFDILFAAHEDLRRACLRIFNPFPDGVSSRSNLQQQSH